MDPERNIVEGFHKEKTSSVSFMAEKYRLPITSMGFSITFGVEDEDIEVSSVESLPTVAKLHEGALYQSI